MSLFRELCTDETGLVMSAELVLLGTVGVIGATVGLNMLATSVNEELKDFAYAIRSLDQSYSFSGFSSCRASTAGSCFQQQAVEVSLAELGALEVTDAEKSKAKKKADAEQRKAQKRKKKGRQKKAAEKRKQ